MRLLACLPLAAIPVGAVSLSGQSFNIELDDTTGAVVKLSDRNGSGMNWVSSYENAPWLPLGSRWGLGFADLGASLLHRSFWTNAKVLSKDRGSYTAAYSMGDLDLTVTRKVSDGRNAFSERYTFTNKGSTALNLASRGTTSLAIYTPFNDHYSNTTDALKSRAHAHIWANGGTNGWVKMNQMGGNGRNLGLVLNEGSLAGYSVESRDPITLSNTRGAILLHPTIPELSPGQSESIEWELFWHGDWDDFFSECSRRSDQFIQFDIKNHTLIEGESTIISMKGGVNSESTINGERLNCSKSSCTFTHNSGQAGKKTLVLSTPTNGTTKTANIYLNTVPDLQDLISKRTRFIVDKQQISAPGNSTDGAYVVFDTQAQVVASWENSSDRNAGRERVGMGILMARWLKKNPNDDVIRESLEKYYSYVSLELQDENGYVFDRPSGTGQSRKRLYNWPWVLQLHIAVASLDLKLTGEVAQKTPLERFMLTLENFYSEGGAELYAIGLPILESLRYLKAHGDDEDFQRARSLFIAHGQNILDRGLNYPAFEVNFEQSIVAPAAVMMLELHRFTGNKTWLEAGELQLSTLLRFEGKQPDYRLHDVAIRHWDGYWFGKDRHWGDTFPHYWSTLDAIALHHYSKATGDEASKRRSEGIIRANLALFDADGKAGCAWIYPISVNGRSAHYRDPYANDQDWALNHLLFLQEDDAYVFT